MAGWLDYLNTFIPQSVTQPKPFAPGSMEYFREMYSPPPMMGSPFAPPDNPAWLKGAPTAVPMATQPEANLPPGQLPWLSNLQQHMTGGAPTDGPGMTLRINKPNVMPASNPPPSSATTSAPPMFGAPDTLGAINSVPYGSPPSSSPAASWGERNKGWLEPLGDALTGLGQGIAATPPGSSPLSYLSQGAAMGAQNIGRTEDRRLDRRLKEAQVGKAESDADTRAWAKKLYADTSIPMPVRMAAIFKPESIPELMKELDGPTQLKLAEYAAQKAGLVEGATKRAGLAGDITQAEIAKAAAKAGAEKSATIFAETTPGAIEGQSRLKGEIARAESDAKGGTEYQNKAAAGASRAMRANAVLNGMEASGQTTPNLMSWLTSEKSFGSFVASKAEQQYFQAAREFVASVLRVESGAAVSETEFRRYYGTYFPVPGDSPQVVAQKAASREAIIRELAVQGGPMTNKMPGASAAPARPAGPKNDPLGIR